MVPLASLKSFAFLLGIKIVPDQIKSLSPLMLGLVVAGVIIILAVIGVVVFLTLRRVRASETTSAVRQSLRQWSAKRNSRLR